MADAWYVCSMDSVDTERFGSLSEAVAYSQSTLDTLRRPKRIEHGAYQIMEKNGRSLYIGTAQMLTAAGFEVKHG